MATRRRFIRVLTIGTTGTIFLSKTLIGDNDFKKLNLKDDEKVLLSIADAIFPEGGPFNFNLKSEAFIKRMRIFINNLSTIKRLQMKAGLFLLQYSPLFLSLRFKKLTSMNSGERIEYLKSWEKSIFYLKRLIFKGIKVFICLLYFSFSEVREMINYRVPCPITGKPLWEDR